MNELEKARKIINEIDEQMAKLFEKRMTAASIVAEYKREHALPIFDASRENQLVEKNSAFIDDEIIKEYYVNFLKDTMDISKKYQSRLISGMKVAYSGVSGAFAHIAAVRMFPNAVYVPYPDFNSAYTAVEKGECDTCVLPLENSYAGDVSLVLDLVFTGSLFINQMIELEVVHNLIAKKGALLKDIKTVVSHNQALSQCSKYIEKYGFKTIESVNTAISAKQVAECDDYTLAAIASSDTAELYGLEILETNINESRNNTTKFGAFSRKINDSVSNASHFTLVFSVKNEAGALAKTLNIIGSYGFNMASLRSRPKKELMWNYYFYVELEGNVNSIDGKEMLKALEKYCDKLKLVGIYN